MKPQLKQFGVWSEDPNDPDASFWMMFGSLEDAVDEAGEGGWVYSLNAKYLGRFKRRFSLIKEREKKMKSKKLVKKSKTAAKSIKQGTKATKRKFVSKKK